MKLNWNEQAHTKMKGTNEMERIGTREPNEWNLYENGSLMWHDLYFASNTPSKIVKRSCKNAILISKYLKHS